MAFERALACAALAAALVAGCVTTTSRASPATGSTRRDAKSAGFFARLVDRFTARECRVATFSCPYGFGPADEPCECTDPSGRVLFGRTVK
jgi:hypothetical protein